MAKTSAPRIEQVLAALDEAFDTKAWHGTTLLGSLRGICVSQASWRPAEGRHNIWELTLHCAYWKYTVARRLRGDRRGSFPRAGSNWLTRPDTDFTGEKAWRDDVALLRQCHADLRSLVAALDDNDLEDKPSGGEHSVLRMVQGAALHDVYHGGQIQLIKRLEAAR